MKNSNIYVKYDYRVIQNKIPGVEHPSIKIGSLIHFCQEPSFSKILPLCYRLASDDYDLKRKINTGSNLSWIYRDGLMEGAGVQNIFILSVDVDVIRGT